MDEKQFHDSMIELIKYECTSQSKDELLTILRNSFILFDKTSNFSRKWNHLEEYIELRVPIPLLKRAKELEKELESYAEEIYLEPSDTTRYKYEYSGFNIRPKPLIPEDQRYTEHSVKFSDIKKTIIEGIRNAKYSIWVAVAWFTDKELYDELLFKQQQGLNIRIITSDEPSNKYLIEDLVRSFEVVKIPMKGDKNWNRFHEKFCIIDLEYVMHGSYNWSKNAENNNEHWVTSLDRDLSRSFADEFVALVERQS